LIIAPVHRIGQDRRAVAADSRQSAGCRPLRRGRKSLEELRGKLTSPVFRGERLRILWAIEVLERIGSPDARKLLRSVADWAPEAPLTSQARASLKRLESSEK
jgi:hypothetical protein